MYYEMKESCNKAACTKHSFSIFFFLDNHLISYLSSLFVISLSQMSSNLCTVKPVNGLKSGGGFLNNLSYESKYRTFQIRNNGHKDVHSNYSRSKFGDYVYSVRSKNRIQEMILKIYYILR
jgi:hypothetical protein